MLSVTKQAFGPRAKEFSMIPPAKCPWAVPRTPVSPVDRKIREFLDAKTHGEDLLHALYDHVLDEPVPERLTMLLRR
jgi:hypothetical protein